MSGRDGARLDCALHMVATPIGHLGDLSPRALDTLRRADLVLAEDTRVTRRLLAANGAAARVERCDEAATAAGLAKALAVLEAGGSVAFCPDAGTPSMSDPGQRLAEGVIAAGHKVVAVPGPSAVMAALVVSGLPATPFLFSGFLPAKAGARRAALADLAAQRATLVLFETGPRLAASLRDLEAAFGPRQACVARELTKMHEEARRGLLPDLAAHYAEAGAPRGEIVLVVAGAPEAPDTAPTSDEIDDRLRAALSRMRVRDAAARVAAETGLKRSDLYARALDLAAGRDRA